MPRLRESSFELRLDVFRHLTMVHKRAGDVSFSEEGDVGGMGTFEDFALAQNHDPREADLKAFEHHESFFPMAPDRDHVSRRKIDLDKRHLTFQESP